MITQKSRWLLYRVRRKAAATILSVLLCGTFLRILLWLKRQCLATTLGRSTDSIVVIKLDHVGDLFLSSVFLRDLRHTHKKAEIAIVVMRPVLSYVEQCPYVDRVLCFDLFDRQTRSLPETSACRLTAFAFIWRHLSDCHASQTYIPRTSLDYYGGSYLAELIPSREILTFEGNQFEKIRAPQANRYPGLRRGITLLPNPGEHEVVSLARLLGDSIPVPQKLESWICEADHQKAISEWREHEVNGTQRVVAIASGASERDREWPTERFAACARWAIDNGYRVALLGGRDQLSQAEEITKLIKCDTLNFVGRATIAESCAVLSRCCLFVGNDSGPKHMAASVGTPIVEISAHPKNGSNNSSHSPNRFGPWGVPNRVLQPQTHLDSARQIGDISEIPITVVIDAMQSLLREFQSSQLNAP